MKRVTVNVGNELLQRNVLLLPTVQDMFNNCLSKMAQNHNLTVNRTVSSNWILSNLTVALGKHINYCCTTRKFGTMIYRSNSDLIPALSHALWRIRSMTKSTEDPEMLESTTTAQQLNVLDDLNERAHSSIKKSLSNYTENPYEFKSFDIDKLVEQTDPVLWEAVCKLSRTKNEKRGRVHDPLLPSQHSKKVRRLYLLSVLFYCINDRCSMPFHTLVTDLVEGQGGSALLIKILNRLGVCSSADTLARFIQYKVTSLEQQPIPFSDPESHTVVSIDNIDTMHPYARNNMGKQKSSWHGTSIQVVQPMPSIGIERGVNSLAVLFENTSTETDSTTCLLETPTSRIEGTAKYFLYQALKI